MSAEDLQSVGDKIWMEPGKKTNIERAHDIYVIVQVDDFVLLFKLLWFCISENKLCLFTQLPYLTFLLVTHHQNIFLYISEM